MMGEMADAVDTLPPAGLFRANLDATRAYLAGDWSARLSIPKAISHRKPIRTDNNSPGGRRLQ